MPSFPSTRFLAGQPAQSLLNGWGQVRLMLSRISSPPLTSPVLGPPQAPGSLPGLETLHPRECPA
jgi:hypothetical protein